MIRLYDYQDTLLNDTLCEYKRGSKSVVMVLPCGGGKTVIFSDIARRANAKGNSVIICTHRQEILEQVCKTLDKFEVPHETITAGKYGGNEHSTQVASIQTLVKRLDKVKEPTLLIFDECHHVLSNTWRKIISHYGNAKVLGVTATPWRINGEGLGQVFDSMVLGPTAAELMEIGRLARPIYYAPALPVNFDDIRIVGGDYEKGEVADRMNKPNITGDAISHYNKICPGVQAVAFCASVAHASKVAQSFSEAGISAESIDGQDLKRKQKIEDFAAGKIRILTSCELISEGFDLPACTAAIMLRPTASLCVWVQQAGRALRTAPGKEKAIILDHVGNSLRHGFIEHINEWSLVGIKRKSKDKEAMPVCRRCKNCFLVFPANRKSCPECGGEPEYTRKELKKIEGELQAMEAQKIRIAKKDERKNAKSLEALIELGKSRGYKNPLYWAECVMRGRGRRV